ncbi:MULTISPECIES: adenylate kinase [Bacillus cereus group]|uniref:adenylate kinase n=1 Tax=Bacillus cereus group TaxID=86661 RepID=UPI000B4B2303|nr:MULTISPECIES: adenylate kinase [Bacillus cereus group]
MDKLEYEARLNKTYNGTVTPVTRYTNQHATMLFHCDKCGTEFYNKARYMIGKDSQRHICTLPYGDSFGTRLNTVGNSKISPQKRKKQMNPGKMAKRLYEMIIEDYKPHEIARELQVNPAIIKDHFKAEGLI